MNKRSFKILATVSIALMLILFALQLDDDDLSTSGDLLIPELKSAINDINSVIVTRPGDDSTTIIEKREDKWVIASRNDYSADVGKLRELLLALADARIVERKTSNPDLHDQLGLRDPEIEGSKGTRLELTGADFTYKLIVGNAAQGGFRYVRIDEDPQSWLIDRNPVIPNSAGDWLEREIVDVKAADLRAVTIRHPDGEEIRIEKDADEGDEFEVTNLPEGRELSYATVTNSITGVLSALTLDDVRKATDMPAAAVTATFETINGARIVVQTDRSDEESWISLDVTADDDAEELAAVSERIAGWQFRIPQYKANQLTRRWDDILKAEDE